MKYAATVFLAALLPAALPALAQFPGQGDDLTTSLGSFQIQVTNNFAGLFAGCPGYNATTQILKSPTLFDPATLVGRSGVINDGDNSDVNGVAVGTANTTVSEAMLFPPPGFPCAGATGACASGAGTREVHTEVRSLKMTSGPVAVRAGVWYDSAIVSGPPSRVSPGEVESHSGPGGAAANDFPASSYFDVFVQVDVPACGTGGFPGATLYNTSPLIVKQPNITAFPPKIVYLHDSSTIVPILFLNANPPKWNAGDILGYFVLAGHGIGFTNSQSDIDAFNNFMNCQTVGSAPSGPATKTAGTSGGATISKTTPTPVCDNVGATATSSPQTTTKPK
ncbi:MAG TPA: hypothetical protein VI685_02780 [Candidatus Angelobacter sp.]